MSRTMTHRPADDERLLVAPYAPTPERVYLKDLAEHLGERQVALRAIAKRHGWLRRLAVGPFGVVWYVSPYAAQRIIVYIRAQQGAKYMRGEQVHEWREREREYTRRMRKQLALAISRAAAEAEPSAAPGDSGIAETPAVCMDVEPASAGRLRG